MSLSRESRSDFSRNTIATSVVARLGQLGVDGVVSVNGVLGAD